MRDTKIGKPASHTRFWLKVKSSGHVAFPSPPEQEQEPLNLFSRVFHARRVVGFAAA